MNARWLTWSAALLLAFASVGCTPGGVILGKLDTSTWVLVGAEFGTRLDASGKPVTDFEKLDTGRTVVHVRTTSPDYTALLRTHIKPGENNPFAQAERFRCSLQGYYPFLNLADSQGYIVGERPAAQTEHVVAGSESTIFLLEVDHDGASSPDQWIHRVYVLDAVDPVYCWAQERMNDIVTAKATEVAEGYFVESRLVNGTWRLNAPIQTSAVAARQATVAAAIAAAQAAGLPVP